MSSQLIEHRARKSRLASSEKFRESIAGSIGATAELGTRIRAQAGRTSASAKGMIGKTSRSRRRRRAIGGRDARGGADRRRA